MLGCKIFIHLQSKPYVLHRTYGALTKVYRTVARLELFRELTKGVATLMHRVIKLSMKSQLELSLMWTQPCIVSEIYRGAEIREV